MGTKAEPIATNPLATARQLWRLNKDCQLVAKVIGHQDGPLTAAQADALIRACSAGDGGSDGTSEAQQAD